MIDKRKNDDKVKGLPRRRMNMLMGLLTVAVVLVGGSLILRATMPGNGSTGHLYYVHGQDAYNLDLSTGQQTRTDGPSGVLASSPSVWTVNSDGSWLASWDSQNYKGALIITHQDTGNQIELGTFNTGGTIMDWSPDDQWIAFSASAEPIAMLPFPAANEELFRVNTTTKQVEQLTSNDYLDQWPNYSPDGTKIAYVAASDSYLRLWVMDVETKTSKLLVSNQIVYLPIWSPDGQWIAFSTEHTGLGSIWIVRADGRDLQPVRSHQDLIYNLAWLP